jgi:glycosyltransferase involved in cell wall biosynthesis
MSSKPTPIAFLVSRYPDVSHTFILREVLGLRERGLAIEVASINLPPATRGLTASERDEAEHTFYVKRAGPLGALRAAISAFVYPLGLMRGLWFALTLPRGDLCATVFSCFYFLEALILAQWLRARAITHLHVHFATPAATVALILHRIAPVSFSITVHGPDEFFDATRYYLRTKIEAASFIVCISQFARSQLMLLSLPEHWTKLVVSQLGVDTARFSPSTEQALKQTLTILCVGRLVPAKGQRILIEAVERLVRDGRSVQLDLVGDGPDRGQLEQFIRERDLASVVHFAGSVNQDEILAHYRRADVFALASFAEGIPVVLMEAMAMEIPCVATAINGIPELIRDGVDGLLVPASDVAALAAALGLLTEDASLRESLGRAGRRRIQQDYELSASTDRLRGVFHDRLEGRP